MYVITWKADGKQMTSAGLMREAGHSEPVLGTTLRDGGAGAGGGGFRMGDTRAPVADSCGCMVKTTTVP